MTFMGHRAGPARQQPPPPSEPPAQMPLEKVEPVVRDRVACRNSRGKPGPRAPNQEPLGPGATPLGLFCLVSRAF